MKDWRTTLLRSSSSIGEAIERLDKGSMQIVLVVDADDQFVGVLTDGDIRRGLIRGMTLKQPALPLVNKTPKTANESMSRAQRIELLRRSAVRHLPVVDQAGRVVGLETLDEALHTKVKPNTVVIMAGGLGERLRPLTAQTPKPMLQIGGRPIAETLVRNLVSHGFQEIYLSVNYKADVIENHFGSGAEFGAAIKYLVETERLGTAGALGLLPERPTAPILVTNGDILTNLNFASLVEFHETSGAVATIAARDFKFQVPYGVLKTDKSLLVEIEEKPSFTWQVAIGIYVLNPEVIDAIPSGKSLDMPSLLRDLKAMGKSIAVFPVREYWLDIGRLEDFEKAVAEFPVFFS